MQKFYIRLLDPDVGIYRSVFTVVAESVYHAIAKLWQRELAPVRRLSSTTFEQCAWYLGRNIDTEYSVHTGCVDDAVIVRSGPALKLLSNDDTFLLMLLIIETFTDDEYNRFIDDAGRANASNGHTDRG